MIDNDEKDKIKFNIKQSIKVLSILFIRTIEVLENSNTPEIKFNMCSFEMNVESKDDKILKNMILNAIERIELIDLFMTSKYISSYLLLISKLIVFCFSSIFLNL